MLSVERQIEGPSVLPRTAGKASHVEDGHLGRLWRGAGVRQTVEALEGEQRHAYEEAGGRRGGCRI